MSSPFWHLMGPVPVWFGRPVHLCLAFRLDSRPLGGAWHKGKKESGCGVFPQCQL